MTYKQPTEEELLKKFSEKLEVPVEELKTELEATVTEVKLSPLYKNATEDQVRAVARGKFSMRKQREALSDAISWEGIIIGVGDLIDAVAKQKKITEAAFKTDPMKTIKGWIYESRPVLASAEGTPLYPKTDGNEKMHQVGKPLPEKSWLRTIYGVGCPIDPKTKVAQMIQPFTLTLRSKDAIDVKGVPVMQFVKFKALNKTRDEDMKAGEYRVNKSAFTKFEVATTANAPVIEDVLRGIFTHFVQLVELDEYHTKFQDVPTRWIITEGNVANLNLEPNAKTGNMMMLLTDESLMFAGEDKRAVACWIPTDRPLVIDFGVESRVLVVGKTSRGKARDEVTGQKLDDVPGDVMINVYGVYAPELFKVAPEVQPVSESSLVPKPEGKPETEEW